MTSLDRPRAVRGAVQGGVVETYEHPVSGQAQIGLEMAIAQGNSAREGLHCVFGPEKTAAAVGNGDRRSPMIKSHAGQK